MLPQTALASALGQCCQTCGPGARTGLTVRLIQPAVNFFFLLIWCRLFCGKTEILSSSFIFSVVSSLSMLIFFIFRSVFIFLIYLFSFFFTLLSFVLSFLSLLHFIFLLFLSLCLSFFLVFPLFLRLLFVVFLLPLLSFFPLCAPSLSSFSSHNWFLLVQFKIKLVCKGTTI